jgi:hypothetical protein
MGVADARLDHAFGDDTCQRGRSVDAANSSYTP